MEMNITKRQGVFFFAMFISLIALSVFLYQTGVLLQPLVLIIISLFVIAPFSKEFPFAKRMLVLISLLFVGWLLSDIGYALVPFGIAFLIAYLLDPIVTFLHKYKIPRWFSAIFIDLLLFGSVAAVAVFVFPIVFDQLDDAISKISDFIEKSTKYLDSKAFYQFTKQFGLNQ
jgi:predicted PurR-regulated permease PerM